MDFTLLERIAIFARLSSHVMTQTQYFLSLLECRASLDIRIVVSTVLFPHHLAASNVTFAHVSYLMYTCHTAITQAILVSVLFRCHDIRSFDFGPSLFDELAVVLVTDKLAVICKACTWGRDKVPYSLILYDTRTLVRQIASSQ